MNRRIARKVFKEFYEGIMQSEKGRKNPYLPPAHLFRKAGNFLNKRFTKRT